MKKISDIDILNLYNFTIEGEVINRVTGHVLSQQVSYNGYKKVIVCKNGLQRNLRVHRYIAYQHIPNPNGYPYINHKDGNKANNNVDNLEWCTAKMNIKHAKDNGLIPKSIKGEDKFNSKMTDVQIRDIRSRRKIGETYISIYKDYKDIIGWWTFRDIVRGKSWKHVI